VSVFLSAAKTPHLFKINVSYCARQQNNHTGEKKENEERK